MDENSKNLNFQIQRFQEVNFELKNFNYYSSKEFDEEKTFIDFDFEVKSLDVKNNIVTIFLHVQMLFELEKEDYFKIFHADYLSEFYVQDLVKHTKTIDNNLGIHINPLKLLFTISVSTMRGYLLARNQGNFIAEFPFPILMPDNLIREKKPHVKDDYYFFKQVKKKVRD